MSCWSRLRWVAIVLRGGGTHLKASRADLVHQDPDIERQGQDARVLFADGADTRQGEAEERGQYVILGLMNACLCAVRLDYQARPAAGQDQDQRCVNL